MPVLRYVSGEAIDQLQSGGSGERRECLRWQRRRLELGGIDTGGQGFRSRNHYLNLLKTGDLLAFLQAETRGPMLSGDSESYVWLLG